MLVEALFGGCRFAASLKVDADDADLAVDNGDAGVLAVASRSLAEDVAGENGGRDGAAEARTAARAEG